MDTPPAWSDLDLLRAFEPVVRLTQGEFFVPVGVDAYVRHASLWQETPEGLEPVAEPGDLDLEELARRGRLLDSPGLSLSGLSVPTSWRERWRYGRHATRPSFRAGSRLAEVGLLGRSIDTINRVSLLVRGAVPGGSATSAYDLQTAELHPEQPTYFGRVMRDRGFIVCQYWFFYAFNNWRSGFSGVNEHEADWEQVTVYLDGTGAPDARGLPEPRWVVFSAHDETGDDLRRRWDDPDLQRHAGRHPVVFAGAGSHSGAYLPGDYLITVVPPTWGGVVPALRRASKVMAPWARAAQTSGFGIPYIDYARGDGPAIGPGQDLRWHPVVIDDDTPWVRDYRGLWGHDTRDRLGGERGPAGPRYERSGVVRASWGDPLGWAGLAKVAPNPDAELALVARRIDDIDAALAELDEKTGRTRELMAAQAAGLAPGAPEVRALEADERRLTAERLEAVALRDERTRMQRALEAGIPVGDPQAHLRHHRSPLTAGDRRRSRLLSRWAIISTPIILMLLASLLLPGILDRWGLAVLMLVFVLAVEALGRGYLSAFLLRCLLVFAIANLAVLFINNWQVAGAATLGAVAVVILVVNLRDIHRR